MTAKNQAEEPLFPGLTPPNQAPGSMHNPQLNQVASSPPAANMPSSIQQILSLPSSVNMPSSSQPTSSLPSTVNMPSSIQPTVLLPTATEALVIDEANMATPPVPQNSPVNGLAETRAHPFQLPAIPLDLGTAPPADQQQAVPSGSGLPPPTSQQQVPQSMQSSESFTSVNPGDRKHTVWEAISVHTAKCDGCNKPFSSALALLPVHKRWKK